MKKVYTCIAACFVVFNSMAQLPAGNQAPEISLPNGDDTLVNLSAFRGKVVLVDFWASWCAPCRAAIPGISKLYNKYKDKGFAVVGIALDEKKKDWQRAAKYFRMKYTILYDTKAWDSKAALDYQVEMIPANFLIDKEGKIVAVGLDGKELENKILELL